MSTEVSYRDVAWIQIRETFGGAEILRTFPTIPMLKMYDEPTSEMSELDFLMFPEHESIVKGESETGYRFFVLRLRVKETAKVIFARLFEKKFTERIRWTANYLVDPFQHGIFSTDLDKITETTKLILQGSHPTYLLEKACYKG